jgi:hypothetical protein
VLVPELGVVRLDVRVITTAGGCLEPAAVQHREFASVIVDQAAALKFTRSAGNADAPHAEHIGEKGVGDMKAIRVRSWLMSSQRASRGRI